MREDHHIDADDGQRRGRPEPGPAPLAEDQPGEQDGDQRLCLLEHEGLGVVAVGERLRKQDGGDRLRTDRNQDDRDPTPPVQPAKLRDAAQQKGEQE